MLLTLVDLFWFSAAGDPLSDVEEGEDNYQNLRRRYVGIGIAIILVCVAGIFYLRRKRGRAEFVYSQLPSMDAAYHSAMNRSTAWMEPLDDNSYQGNMKLEHVDGRPTLSL